FGKCFNPQKGRTTLRKSFSFFCIIKTAMRFLIIDDDLKASLILKRFLEEEAFAVDHATDANRGIYLARIHDYDLFIINQTRPGEFGLKLCADIRTKGRSVGIIALLSNAKLNQKLEFFTVGVDDCLTHPFSFSELVA